MPGRSRPARLLALGGVVLALGACSASYYGQAIRGQLELLASRRPLAKVRLDDPAGREQLELVQAARRFASDRLELPDNRSYRDYVALDRPFVAWNVVAAPELSVEPVTWCFPVAGCVAYRGYFAHRRAERFAERLERRGLDVALYGVRAYSTLGWFADPVLSTFLDLPPAELAGLVFHELSHQVVYVGDDTAFNESFATAVEQLGLDAWVEAGGLTRRALEAHVESEARDAAFVELALATRAELETIYADGRPEAWQRRRKEETLDRFRRRLAALIAGWEVGDRYDAWMSGPLNNAHFAALGAYHRHVGAFRALFDREGGDWGAFYRAVARLADLEPEERERRLGELAVEAGA